MPCGSMAPAPATRHCYITESSQGKCAPVSGSTASSAYFCSAAVPAGREAPRPGDRSAAAQRPAARTAAAAAPPIIACCAAAVAAGCAAAAAASMGLAGGCIIRPLCRF